MNTYPVRLALAAVIAGMPTVIVVSAFTASSSSTSAAEYCFNNGATSVDGKQVAPGGQYCVPGP